MFHVKHLPASSRGPTGGVLIHAESRTSNATREERFLAQRSRVQSSFRAVLFHVKHPDQNAWPRALHKDPANLGI